VKMNGNGQKWFWKKNHSQTIENGVGILPNFTVPTKSIFSSMRNPRCWSSSLENLHTPYESHHLCSLPWEKRNAQRKTSGRRQIRKTQNSHKHRKEGSVRVGLGRSGEDESVRKKTPFFQNPLWKFFRYH